MLPPVKGSKIISWVQLWSGEKGHKQREQWQSPSASSKVWLHTDAQAKTTFKGRKEADVNPKEGSREAYLSQQLPGIYIK